MQPILKEWRIVIYFIMLYKNIVCDIYEIYRECDIKNIVGL